MKHASQLAIASLVIWLGISVSSAQAELKVGDPAPEFQLKSQDGKSIKLRDRAGKWTVLYFYPKADTPGCTKQACMYRDSLQSIRSLNAEVFGVSADTPKELLDFKNKYHLNFTLLADPEGKMIESYGAKAPLMKIAKRWTFIIDPRLRIQYIDQSVDPVKDAENVAKVISSLQNKGSKS